MGTKPANGPALGHPQTNAPLPSPPAERSASLITASGGWGGVPVLWEVGGGWGVLLKDASPSLCIQTRPRRSRRRECLPPSPAPQEPPEPPRPLPPPLHCCWKTGVSRGLSPRPGSSVKVQQKHSNDSAPPGGVRGRGMMGELRQGLWLHCWLRTQHLCGPRAGC